MTNLKDIMRLTFCHTCTIKRDTMVKKGSMSRPNLVVVAENVPCAVSGGSGASGIKGDAYIPIEYTDTIFTAPDVDLRAGDIVEANIYGKIETFTAGEGRVYPSHLQAPLTRKGRA